MISLITRLPAPLKNLLYSIYGLKLLYFRGSSQDNHFKEFELYDDLSAEVQKKWIQDRLTHILKSARENVSFYRRYWDEHCDIDFLELSNWPILNKSSLRGREDIFIAEGKKKEKLIKISTSGTTGTPMVFYFDRKSYSRWYAVYYYHLLLKNGIDLKNDNWANIGGRIICDPAQKKPPFWVYNYPMKQLYMSSYHLSPENIKFYIKELERQNVKYIVGYPSSINEIAAWVNRNNHNLKLLLKGIFTNAEPLLFHQRERIEKAFKCRIIQTYGSSEFAVAASEDKQGKMQVWPQTGILEVVNPSEQGNGEFLVTGLVNEAMPLIRYKIGDSGVVEKSGDFASYILSIDGRTDDLIRSASGRIVGRLDPIFKKDIKIMEVQIVQEAVDRILFRVVKGEGYSKSDEELLLKEALKRLGDEFTIYFEYVSSIPRTKNGKFKSVVSLVNNDHNGIA